jgi:hypothetical protein
MQLWCIQKIKNWPRTVHAAFVIVSIRNPWLVSALFVFARIAVLDAWIATTVAALLANLTPALMCNIPNSISASNVAGTNVKNIFY